MIRSFQRITIFFVGGLCLFFAGLPLIAEKTSLENHLSQYCFRCHGEEKTKGGLNLAQLLTQRPLIKNREQWNHVVDLVSAGDMPPEDEDQPNAEERRAILRFLDRELNHFDFSKIDDPGFENARRLTNQEYNNTISDLFGKSLAPADRFPADLTGASGFENSANTLFLQASRMERYIAAAERIVESALPAESLLDEESASFQRIFSVLSGNWRQDAEEAVETEAAARRVFTSRLSASADKGGTFPSDETLSGNSASELRRGRFCERGQASHPSDAHFAKVSASH